MSNELLVEITSQESTNSIVSTVEAQDLIEVDVVVPTTTTSVETTAAEVHDINIVLPTTATALDVDSSSPIGIEVDLVVQDVNLVIDVFHGEPPAQAPALSADPDNRARYGSDNGIFVPQYEDTMDPIAYYILAKS